MILIVKYAYLYQCNQGIMIKCSNHDRDALLRCMIEMMMQHEDGEFHARSRWCVRHDARMMILAMYARMKCMKYDAYPHELMMHMTRSLQLFARN
jgi:hypothetical protein